MPPGVVFLQPYSLVYFELTLKLVYRRYFSVSNTTWRPGPTVSSFAIRCSFNDVSWPPGFPTNLRADPWSTGLAVGQPPWPSLSWINISANPSLITVVPPILKQNRASIVVVISPYKAIWVPAVDLSSSRGVVSSAPY